MRATVVGAGLAGCEAAWQLLKRGVMVDLYEMKPHRFSPAHTDARFAELVCSNSLRSNRLTNGVGLLKEEMRRLDSLIISAADKTCVPSGGALAVDRGQFMDEVTGRIKGHPNIRVHHEAVESLPPPPYIIATGPLTEGALFKAIQELPGMRELYFFDAAAPIVTADSLNMDKIFRQSRYDRGDGYLNCPMNEEEYNRFYDALVAAETAQVHEFDKKHVFEGCLAVEILASRGRQTLLYGTMKPMGLTDPATGRRPYAVVQLRQDDAAGTLYNLVGFQTRLKWGEQKRVFSMIPGLENAEFARFGVMHRNTYIHAPGLLGRDYALLSDPLKCFAGQITGVEGYVESAASGLVAGLNLARKLLGKAPVDFGGQTAIGALARYVTTPNANFQPMNANFGIIDPMGERVRGKQNRYEKLAKRALLELPNILCAHGEPYIEPGAPEEESR